MGIIYEEEIRVSQANLSAFVLPFIPMSLRIQQKFLL